ncbi:uncharacterized protein PRD47_005879 [Ara ararauna]
MDSDRRGERGGGAVGRGGCWGLHRPPGARCREGPGGRRRPEPRVAAEERERGEGSGGWTRTRGERGEEKGEGARTHTHTHTHTHTPRWKSLGEAGAGSRRAAGQGWPRDAPSRRESWGEPGRTGDHPKSKGGPIRLPASPLPPLPPPSPPGGVPSSSRELRPGPAGSCGARGAGARGKLRRGAVGSDPGCACPGGAASAVWRPRERSGAGQRRRGAAGPHRGLLSRPEPPSFPRRHSQPCPQPRCLNESETRGCGGGGLAPGEGGGTGEGERRREAPRSVWSWEDAAAATWAKTPGETETVPATGRVQVVREK